MDTDADTEPWVGTVKSIQAQAEDDSQDEEVEIAGDTVDEVEDMNEEEVVTSQKEEEVEREEIPKGNEEQNENHDIVLKLDESEEELSQDEKNNENCVEIEQDHSKGAYVISRNLVAETVVNSIEENEIDASKDVKMTDKTDVVQDEPDSTTGRVTPVQHQFKTPPRPSRLSVMPPTPPESGQSTPPQQVNTLKVSSNVDCFKTLHVSIT